MAVIFGTKPTRHRFTVEDFHRLGEHGFFRDDERVELIEGELIEMPPIGSEHAGLVAQWNERLILATHGKALVFPQNPIRLSDLSEIHPDLMLLKPRADYYRQSLPEPPDVLLVIEIADAIVHRDRRKKVPLYARHGVTELWLLDVQKQRVTVYRQPSPDGYRLILKPAPEESISPLALPDLGFAVSEIWH